jgi:hypothetical protein
MNSKAARDTISPTEHTMFIKLKSTWDNRNGVIISAALGSIPRVVNSPASGCRRAHIVEYGGRVACQTHDEKKMVGLAHRNGKHINPTTKANDDINRNFSLKGRIFKATIITQREGNTLNIALTPAANPDNRVL